MGKGLQDGSGRGQDYATEVDEEAVGTAIGQGAEDVVETQGQGFT